MIKTILYLLILCTLCLSCKVKAKVSGVPVAIPAKTIVKAQLNVSAVTRIVVDSHGQTMDTDGNGIPDYRDLEKLTGNRCLPVDINGVGTCPEPSYCANLGGSKLQTD